MVFSASWPRRFGMSIIAFVIATIAGSLARADEPGQGFLQEMRRRGLHDVALEYLQTAKANPTNEPGLQSRIDFELGVTLLDLAKLQSDAAQREALFQQSAQALATFLKEHGDSSEVGAASGRLAEIGILRGLARIEDIDRSNVQPLRIESRQKLTAEAKQVLDDAARALTAQRQFAEKQVEAWQAAARKDPKLSSAQPRKLETLAAEVVAVQMHSAYVEQLKARLYAPASNEAKLQWKAAATAYRRIFDEHKKTSFAALEARVGEGRCLQLLGDSKGALAALEECLAAPDEPARFRALKTRALLYAGECWIDPAAAKPQLAIARIEEWFAAAQLARGEIVGDEIAADKAEQGIAARFEGVPEASDGTELALQYVVARAKEMIVSQGAASKRTLADATTEISPERRAALVSDALRRAIAAASGANAHRSDAVELIDRLLALAAKDSAQPATFAAAKLRADTRVASMQAKMASHTASDKAIATMADEAIAGYRTALARLKDDVAATSAVDVEAINDVRHALCQLFYQRGRYREAAMLGELLLSKYPTSRGARHAALVALASWMELGAAAKSGASDADVKNAHEDAAKIAAIAERIRAAWPNSDTTDEIGLMTAAMELRRGDLTRAEAGLSNVSDGVRAQRLRLEIGMRLADQWLGNSSGREAGSVSTLRSAREQLQASVEPLAAAGQIDEAVVRGALALAQIELQYAGRGDVASRTHALSQTIRLLEAKEFGPLTLLISDSAIAREAAAKQNGFATTTFDAALQAYALGASGDAAFLVKAGDVIAAMPRILPPEQCLAIYARLPEAISGALAQTPSDRRGALAAGYAKLVAQVRDGANGKQRSALVSVLNSLEALAIAVASVDEASDVYERGAAEGNEAAKAFYREAVVAGEQALKLPGPATGDADSATNERQAVQAIVARCRWRSGDFDGASKIYREILAARPLLLDVQSDAARMLQQRARAAPEYLKLAIRGTVLSEPNLGEPKPGDAGPGQATVYGWTQLARIAAQNEQFAATFQEARYQLAVCYFELGLREKDAKRAAPRGGSLETARRAIEVVYRKDPDLGGDERRAAYDRLLRAIQRELGAPDVGLAEFRN